MCLNHRRTLWSCIGLALVSLFAITSIDQVGAQGDSRSVVEDLILEEKFSEAESLAKQWLASSERTSEESAEVADALDALARIYAGLKRFNDAEAVGRRCLSLRVKIVGPKHALITRTIDILASIYTDEGRHADAQALWRDGLAAFDKGPSVAAVERLPNPSDPTHQKLPDLIARGELGKAEQVLRQSGDWTTLGTLLLKQKRVAEAVDVHRRLMESAPTADRAVNIATLYRQHGLPKYEQEFLERAVAIQEKTLGLQHENLIPTLTALGTSFEKQSDLANAYSVLKRVTGISSAARSRLAYTTPTATALQLRQPHLNFLRVAARLAREQPAQAKTITADTFEAGQLATETVLNVTLSQIGLRFSKGSGPLPELIRSRQDLERQWQQLDKLLLAAVTSSSPLSEKERLRSNITDAEKRLTTIDEQLRRAFPQYFNFGMPRPINVADVQKFLSESEALVLFSVVGADAYVWVITKLNSRWAALPMNPADIEIAVAALRCGLDYSGAWTTDRCRGLLKRDYTKADSRFPKPLPFDLAIAHKLYVALFGLAADSIAGKDLLVIPSGPLSSLPLQVLVTQKPESALPGDWQGYSRASWLVKTHALAILPSAASIKVLRAQAGKSGAVNPYVAFANPILTGPSGKDQRAGTRQRCDEHEAKVQRVARELSARAAPTSFFRGEVAVAERVRALQPLVETTDEVCAVATRLGAAQRDVFLGQNATEATVRSLSRSGRLANYRVIHFATHGLLANETEIAAGGPAEPSLVLTPPAIARSEDDGVLTSSEIALLKLNAEWVILSACNTAGGDQIGADTLSGLARAFFYAGSRALLVSHWAVDSVATVMLITTTFDELEKHPTRGRAKALQQAMLSMIAKGNDPAAHPAYWAPFVVVGDVTSTEHL